MDSLLAKYIENRDQVVPYLSTGDTRLDAYTGGNRPGLIEVIGAAPKVGKCLAPGTLVRMSDTSLKKVEDIKVGDTLLSHDGIPNPVINLVSGTDTMYTVHQSKGISYTCNSEHLLHINNKKTNENENVKVSELPTGRRQINHLKAVKKQYSGIDSKLPLEPYFLGIWLGDGAKACPSITTTDQEIVDYLTEFSKRHSLRIRKSDIAYYLSPDNHWKIDGKRYETSAEVGKQFGMNSHWASNLLSYKNVNSFVYEGKTIEKVRVNSLKEKMSNLLFNKRIPVEYMCSSIDDRLQLLAGLIDSDGTLAGNKYKTCYSITQKEESLIRDIKDLADSLGFFTRLRSRNAKCKECKNDVYPVWRLYIYHNCDTIPVKIARKKISYTQRRDASSTLRVESIGEGEYFGFTLGNHPLFYLEDYTTTHNSKWVNETKVIEPYLDNLAKGSPFNLKFKYFSFEIDRTSMMYDFAAYFMYRDHDVDSFIYTASDGSTHQIEMSGQYLAHKLSIELSPGVVEQVKVMPQHERLIWQVDSDRIVPLFGNDHTEGIIEVIEKRTNPTGINMEIYKEMKSRGSIITKKIKTKEGEVINMFEEYKCDDPTFWLVVIVDHIRKVKPELQMTLKQSMDATSDYAVQHRNRFSKHLSYVIICHLNRALGSIERQKYMGDDLYPTGDDFKDSGRKKVKNLFYMFDVISCCNHKLMNVHNSIEFL